MEAETMEAGALQTAHLVVAGSRRYDACRGGG